MRRGQFVALFACTLAAPPASAEDGFVEVAGGIVIPGGSDGPWAEPGPKLALRAGTMDRKWADYTLSIDWTLVQPLEEHEVAGLSAHRFRAVGSYVFNTRIGGLNLGARTGVGFDFMRLSTSSESDTLIGYAFEVGVGLWFDTGPVEVGGDIALPFGLHGATTIGDIELDGYVSIDIDLLMGVRHVWR